MITSTRELHDLRWGIDVWPARTLGSPQGWDPYGAHARYGLAGQGHGGYATFAEAVQPTLAIPKWLRVTHKADTLTARELAEQLFGEGAR